MSPRKRNRENIGLPTRWKFQHGAYYYRVPPGQENQWDGKKMFRLGKSMADAHACYALRIGSLENISTIAQLLDRYQIETVPQKKAATQKSNLISIRRLRAVFADNPIGLIKAQHVIQYRDAVSAAHGKIAANRDLEVLSHAFSKAIEWGILDNAEHPMRGLRLKNKKQPRTRYVTDDELAQALTVASDFLLNYIHLKGLTGLRKGDLLSIKLADITADGIAITPRKTESTTGRKKIIPVTPAIDAAIKAILSARGKVAGMYLFATRKGKPYISDDGITSGFDSIWQRFMAKVVQLGIERFTEHDLRAKVASDADSAHAQELMDHSTSEITERVYRRKAKVVQPAKGFRRANDTSADL